jgi:hypothetical protein
MAAKSSSVSVLLVKNFYAGHCRCSGSSDVFSIIVQILLRTGYFTDSPAQTSGAIFKIFRKLHAEMMNNKPWLDISPLIRVCPSVLGGRSELADCFSGLFRLLGSALPRMTHPLGVVFRVPHGDSVLRYFSQLAPDLINELGVIFFETRSVVLSDIPQTLDHFSLYVVVSRLSKTSHRLWFQDSKGWLSISGRDIEDASSFQWNNISLLGYIRDLKHTNVFRCPLNSNKVLRRPYPKAAPGPLSETHQPEFTIPDKSTSVSLLVNLAVLPLPHPKQQIRVVFWSDPEKSSWGTETRKTVDIECNATGSYLLKAFCKHLCVEGDLSTGYEIVKVFSDLERMKMITPTDPIDAKDGDVFFISSQQSHRIRLVQLF